MAYLVLAYPKIGKSDYQLIQNYRKEHDDLFYSVVKPHFTVVFPVLDQTEKDFVGEIRKMVQGIKGFEFVLRCATINKDAFSNYYHAFLVPDEGYSRMVKLHDRLYSDLLKNNLRLDIDYIPHIGIGNSKDKFECKKMVDEWNEKDFAIKGTISELTIVNYNDNKVEKLESIEL